MLDGKLKAVSPGLYLVLIMGLLVGLTGCGGGTADEAILLDLQLAVAYGNRGLAYSKLGQYQKAIAEYDEAIRLNPEYRYAYLGRGFAFQALGDSIKAEQDFAKAKELGVE